MDPRVVMVGPLEGVSAVDAVLSRMIDDLAKVSARLSQ